MTSYSQNKSFIESASDLDELLVGDAYTTETVSIEGSEMDDDADLGKPDNSLNAPGTQSFGFHFWQADPRIDSDGRLTTDDDIYNYLYKKISILNTVLHNVELLRSKGESTEVLNRIAGEAHFLRACYFFNLVNFYGKPYKETTAGTDFGVPLKIDPSIQDQFIHRSTTQQVYDQILKDLLIAEQKLQGVNAASTIRVNQAAVQGLLSKVYLYMENYSMAVLFADKVMKRPQYQLKDLNEHISGKDFLTRHSPEVIFTMGKNKWDNSQVRNLVRVAPYLKVSDDLLHSYSEKDLRLNYFFIRDKGGNSNIAKKIDASAALLDDVSSSYLIRLSELYLNKAEALAALDRFEEARNTLQEFRKNRFKTGELPPIHSEGEILMNVIRDERRRELCFENHRWFDLRRYGVNRKYPFSKIIRHRSLEYVGGQFIENGYYELKSYAEDAAAYIVPIAHNEIEFHQGLLVNEPRPNRPLIK